MLQSKMAHADSRYDNMKRAYELTTQDLQLCQEENGRLKASLICTQPKARERERELGFYLNFNFRSCIADE